VGDVMTGVETGAEPQAPAAIAQAEPAAAEAAPTEVAEAEPEAPTEVAEAEPPATTAVVATRDFPDVEPVPRPEPTAAPQASLVVPPRPADPDPEDAAADAAPLEPVYGVSLGAQPSHHAAERLLLRTALSEIGTFDQALRQVLQRSSGFEARFQGLTEDQAARACARLSARNVSCETVGPAS